MLTRTRSLFFIGILFLLCSFNAPIKWVAIGDSITYLNEHPMKPATESLQAT
jgi:hypothetical protein